MAVGGRRPGAGRPLGSKTKAGQDIRALAQKYCPDAMKELGRLAIKAESEAARVAAINILLDRGYGKATQQIEAKVEGRIVLAIDLS